MVDNQTIQKIQLILKQFMITIVLKKENSEYT